MKVLVLGGTGLIGTAVVNRLASEGHKVRVFHHRSASANNKNQIDSYCGSIENLSELRGAMKDMGCVVHSASATFPSESQENPRKDMEINLFGALNVMDAMVAEGIRKIIFISSGGTVYGRARYLPIDENHPTDPLVPYGITKLAIEKYLNLHKELRNFDVRILRVSNAYGNPPRTRTQGAVNVFLLKAMRSEKIEIWGDGNVRRDFVHVDDIASAVNLSLSYTGDVSVFNVASNHGISLLELIEVLERFLGNKINYSFLPKRGFDVDESILDNSLARCELGWIPLIRLEQGITRIKEFYDAQFRGATAMGGM